METLTLKNTILEKCRPYSLWVNSLPKAMKLFWQDNLVFCSFKMKKVMLLLDLFNQPNGFPTYPRTGEYADCSNRDHDLPNRPE